VQIENLIDFSSLWTLPHVVLLPEPWGDFSITNCAICT